MCNGPFLACGEALEFEGRPFLAEEDGDGSAALFGLLELLADLGGGEGVVDAVACVSQGLEDAEGVWAALFVGEDEEEVCGVVVGDPAFHLFAGRRGVLDEVLEDDVAHAEAEGGEVDLSVAHEAEKVVVAAAACEGAFGFVAVEHLEDEACVVSEAADDGEVEFYEAVEAAGAEVVGEGSEAGGLGFRIAEEGFDVLKGDAEFGELGADLFWGGAFEFVDDGEEVQDAVFGYAAFEGELGPCVAVADADDEVFLGEAEGAQHVDEDGEHLCVCGRGGFTDDVAVELVEFAEASALLFFVAEELWEAEPLEGFFEVAFACGDHACEGGGHFRAHGDVAPALVDEIEELAEEFAAALFFVELDGFEDGAVVFGEAVAACDLAPAGKDVVSAGAVLGIKVAEAWEQLHGGWKLRRGEA